GAGRDCAVTFSPDGRHFLFARENHAFWCDSTTGKKIRRYDMPQPACMAAQLAPDGLSLVVGAANGTVQRWETASIETLPERTTGGGPLTCLVFSPDAKRLAACGQDGNVKVFDVAGEAMPAELRTGAAMVRALAFAPDGKTLAIGNQAGAIQLWDVATSKM